MQKTNKTIALLFSAALASCLAFTACGKKSSSGGGSSSGGASSAASSGDKGAIEFHNKLVDFSQLAREPFRKIMQTSKDSANWVERDGVVGEKPMWNLVLSGINPYEKLAKNNLAAPKSFSSADQEFFNSRIKLAKDGAAELNKIVGTLIAYYKAEDYKDDKHKKFLDLQPRIAALVQQVATATGEMGDRSTEIAKAIERENLKKNPIGIYIINMQDVMAKCREQMEGIMDDRLVRDRIGTGSKSDAEKAAEVAKVKDLLDPADALSAEIAGMLEKAKAVDMSALAKRQTLAKDYENFMKAVENQQGDVRKNLRFAKEFGYIGIPGDMKNLQGTLSKVVGAYNSFVDHANKGN